MTLKIKIILVMFNFILYLGDGWLFASNFCNKKLKIVEKSISIKLKSNVTILNLFTLLHISIHDTINNDYCT